MSLTHVHLIVNHLPVAGGFFAFLLLLYAYFAKNRPILMAGCAILLISAAGATVAYLTGEAAEETVENIASVSETTVERHEDAAVLALVLMLVAAAFSILTIVAARLDLKWRNMAAALTLAVTAVAMGSISWTAFLGGQVRHTEIAGAAPAAGVVDSHESDDD